ncbi:MAG: leucine-rich repeat domain-containing protein [Prolixibacteraceae bacterium]|jgi:Leucine-rich repeat (LRR) protein
MHEIKAHSVKLLEAWSEPNLNKIAQNLILLYKEKQFEKLNVISELIAEWVEIKIEADGKGFAKIISLYHPDRGASYRSQIELAAADGDTALLSKFEHIFVIQDIEEIAANIESYEDIDYHPEYEWDVTGSGFSYFQESDKKTHKKQQKTRKGGYTVYEAVQIRQFGDTATGFPVYYLEELDELELSECEIDDLDGLEYCIHTVTLDLSFNRIYDLANLAGLTSIQELNLSNNQIGYIDALVFLPCLKSVDLSYNSIDDISSLFEIETLEFADLTGNKIPLSQIEELRKIGVTVEF